ncbi:deoxyribonuclease-2-alpha [Reticulomyxa filosa]|uniref:Deoxyribonuclease-2-alpha n=1 Tax=Reticulomyxa filosa TaxID=46433 RepID=X6NUR6_RETFI|nr:deoxyribonuclease-2-alpha [Reticulomyxa filosa]|eukprot:ETO30045.1 deoxyribonuclease-2-alpha [Reticulomyxa filosa]
MMFVEKQSITVRLFVLLSVLVWCVNSGLQCLDNSGSPVDWWFIYKVNNGYTYAYFENEAEVGLKVQTNGQTLQSGQNSALERTLNQIYKNKTTVNYIIYNDEKLDGSTPSGYGHTKGVLAFDARQNFQSVTLFRVHFEKKKKGGGKDTTNNQSKKKKKAYQFASSTTYAQSFLCLTFTNYSEMNVSAYQLRYEKPYVLNYNIVDNESKWDNWNQVTGKKWLSGKSIQQMSTWKRFPLVHFARSGDISTDIMEAIISPYYHCSFAWETWIRSPAEDSYCPPTYSYMELNVNLVTFADGTSFKETQDHSKIGISFSCTSQLIVCVGSLNRMTSQDARGGGYACFYHANLWNTLNSSFFNISYCPANSTTTTTTIPTYADAHCNS